MIKNRLNDSQILIILQNKDKNYAENEWKTRSNSEKHLLVIEAEFTPGPNLK